MKARLLLAGAALALTSTFAFAAPESLLPPVFDEPAPAPSPQPDAPTARSSGGARAPSGGASQGPRPQPGRPAGPAASAGTVTLPANLPSLRELEAMDADEVDELLGLKPKFDIPPAARRAVREIGVIGASEGGFEPGLLDDQPPALVRSALDAMRRPLVSRWGHILLRRALASRMDAPRGMDPVSFAALRVNALNRMGEAQTARALAQDIDSSNYNSALAGAALNAYLGSGDVLGICPVARLKSTLLDEPEWEMSRYICAAYAGEGRQADRDLQRALYRGLAPRIDVLLAQRFAGAAGDGRRSVTIEWNDVDELNPWRFALARALGVELPENLRDDAAAQYDIADVQIPAVPLEDRVAAADGAAARGVISSTAMIDLYSQLWAEGTAGEWRDRSINLREAYLARDPAARLAAMRELWGNGDNYGRQVLTAYAAARLPVAEALADDAAPIIASMLAAGLDQNAMRWGAEVSEGSRAWALLALAQPNRQTQVSTGAVEDFIDEDGSGDKRQSRFLIAGLAGLGRLDNSSASELASDLGVNLNRESAWSRKIDRAAELGNPALVSLLAGLGMQGDSWDKMTARHLFHIVRALNRVGLNGEARMIAAEAVARG